MGGDTRPSSAVARVRSPSGDVAGAGFLATADLVVTCAHVLGAEPPAGPVTVEFPLADAGPVTAAAEVVRWVPPEAAGGDVAVLRLTGTTPPGVRPARLVAGVPRWGDPVQVFGFPADLGDLGAWAAAEMRAGQAAGWLQVEATEPGRVIQRGYSGAPAWSPATGRVAGMVVASDRGARHDTAYLLPTAALVAAHPPLGEPDGTETPPYRGLEPFHESHATLFRGREQLTADLAARTARHPVVLVTGPSGSGKSSLVRAGLIPAARAAGRRVVLTRVRPGRRPAELLAGVTPDDDGTLLVIDQFEEAPAADARTLLGLILDLTTAAGRRADRTPRIAAVLTARAGMLDSLLRPETAEALTDGLMMVPPMSGEQLRAAIQPPGVAFEDGLVERLVADAGAEPGRLALLEFTLDRLWAHRRAGTLTHAAYDEAGGVSGAIARYAEEVYATLGPERRAARRLLVQMARPEPDGTFRRRPVLLADLDERLRRTARVLAATRLVVAGDDIVEPAHQALIDRWERLRGWLAEDRDFRLWQEELRRNRAAWAAGGHDPGGLPRGAALATAAGWARRRSDDLAPADHEYVRAGLAAESRRLRRLRLVVAVVTVLAVAAGGLALAAIEQRDVARDALRLAASRELADDAQRFDPIDPATSLQLSLAAWREGHTPEAYGALLARYAAVQPADKVFTGLWDGDFDSLTVADGGDRAILVTKAGDGRVWTGLTGDHPRRIVLGYPGDRHAGGLYQISRSGRYAAYADPLGGALMWDLSRPDAPITLAGTGVDGPQPRVARSLAFAADDTRLVLLRTATSGDGPAVQIWDLPGGRPVTVAESMTRGRRPDRVFPGPGRDEVVVAGWLSGFQVADVRTGRVRRSYPSGGTVAADGRLLITCRAERLTVTEVATGRRVRTVPVDSCAAPQVESTTSYVVTSFQHKAGASNAYLSVADPATGRGWSVILPPLRTEFLGSTRDDVQRLAVTMGRDGRPLILAGDHGMLFRVRGGDPVELRAADRSASELFRHRATAVSPDGRHTVHLDRDGTVEIVETAAGRRVAAITAPPPPPGSGPYNGSWFAFTATGDRLLTAHGDQLVVRSVPDLRTLRTIPLPAPDLGPPPAADEVTDAWASSVLPGAGDDVVVLHAGVFTRWNVATGERIGEPVPLRTGDVGARRRAATLAFATMRRPGHPQQAAVVLPDGTIAVWDLAAGRPIMSLPWDAAPMQDALTFDTTGGKLAAFRTDAATAVIDMARPATTRVLPTADAATVLGFTPAGHLLSVQGVGAASVVLWDERNGKQLAMLSSRSVIPDSWRLRGSTLSWIEGGLSRTVELDPDRWFRELCAIGDRPFTAAERDYVLEDRGRPTPPCREG